MFRIHSAISDREIIFSKNQADCFEVEICDSALRYAHSVWHDYEYPNVDEFFNKLAAFGQPWQGERMWESLEGDLKLSAICFKTGNVRLFINIRQYTGGVEESNINTYMMIELGQLNSIAEGMRDFFKN